MCFPCVPHTLRHFPLANVLNIFSSFFDKTLVSHPMLSCGQQEDRHYQTDSSVLCGCLILSQRQEDAKWNLVTKAE